MVGTAATVDMVATADMVTDIQATVMPAWAMADTVAATADMGTAAVAGMAATAAEATGKTHLG
jgi:hypothetical protein